MKKTASALLSLCLAAVLVLGTCVAGCAGAEEYIGDMQVVNCNEWVSLREQPSASATRLVKVSLGAVVSNCSPCGEEWVYAEYDGYAGYIMARYLEPAEGVLTFNAMLVTRSPEGAPFYATIDSTEPLGTILPDTIVRNCCMMDNGRVYAEWGGRCGFIEAAHAEVYNEMLHYPRRFTMLVNLYSGGYDGPPLDLKIDYAESMPLSQYEYTEAVYDLEEYENLGFPPLRYVLYSEETLGRIHLYSIEVMNWDDETGEAEFQLTLEDMQYELEPGRPLAVTAILYGMLPNLAVGFEDPQGQYHFAFVEMSGEDGSLLLKEF